MSEHDCNKCPYEKLCEELRVFGLSCYEIKQIAQDDEVGSLYEICG